MESVSKGLKQETSIFSISSMAKIAMLSAMAMVLMLFEIPLWFAPSFYEIDFSEVPVLIGCFAMGPLAGVTIEFIKIILNFIFNGTTTGGIGEVANFLIGCSLVLPAAYFYKYKRSRKSAILGLITGTAVMTVVGCLLNAYVLLPFYAKLFMPMESLIGAGTMLNSNITNITTFVLFAVAPFNLLKGVLVSIITILLYKHISPLFKSNH